MGIGDDRLGVGGVGIRGVIRQLGR
jgi:hypothetical protein